MMDLKSKGGAERGQYLTAGKSGEHLYKHGGGYQQEMQRTGESMSKEAQVRRYKFAAHYIKTTNASAAATFAGFSSPGVKGAKLLKEPYVQNLIQNLLNALDQDAIMSQNEILFRFKEEACNVESGNAGTRVSALAHIAKIRGMMIERTETKLTSEGGVMVVPMVASAEEWGEHAAKSQAELKKSARE